jgi:hypothetical protein
MSTVGFGCMLLVKTALGGECLWGLDGSAVRFGQADAGV